MKIEDQVCSLELARKLKELDVKQESYFAWLQQGKTADDWSESILMTMHEVKSKSYFVQDGYCSAFSVAELGEMLPMKRISFTKSKDNSCLCLFYDYEGVENYPAIPIFKSVTEADARAKLLIHLIESKLIEVQK